MQHIELDPINIQLESALGEFQIKKWKGDECTYDSGIIDNVVTNGYYQKVLGWAGYYYGSNTYDLSSGRILMWQCSVSNNTSEVVKSDLLLTQKVGTSKTVSETLQTGGAYYPIVTKGGKQYYQIKQRYLWAMGAFTGQTITKVGIETSENVLICGQLIRDGFGAPMSVTILADEQLDITYSLFVPVYVAVPDTEVHIISVNGVNVEYKINKLLQNFYQMTANTFYFRSYTDSRTASYRWSYLNNTVYNHDVPVRTAYDTSYEYTITLNIGVTASNFIPITKIENCITSSYYSSNSTDNQPLLQYEFLNSTLTKLTTDAISFVNKVTFSW